jgi:hypothetical protein
MATDTQIQSHAAVRTRYLDLSLLGVPELVLCIAGPVLLVTLFFVPWFSVDGTGTIHGHHGSATGWQTYTFLRYFLLWCGVGAFILPWMVARRHDDIAWRRGEMTAVHGLIGITLLLLNGLAFAPGNPPGSTHIEVGYLVALVVLAAFVYAGVRSADRHEPVPRRPPGV